MRFSLLSVLLVLELWMEATTHEILVNTKSGLIEGSEKKTFSGNKFYGFQGIPYAEPPIGELRFKKPLPKKPWKGILNGKKYGPHCFQPSFFTNSINGQEDCLNLDVFTSTFSNSTVISQKPVVVFIYGGGFFYGESSTYGPRYLLDHEVVYVRMNYRLHALGFLSTGDEAASGNYGLLDQVEALKWVKQNIGLFGGDPNRVTIIGHSSGSACIFYHMLSPVSTGLFHQAMAISGTAIAPYTFSKEPLTWAKYFAKEVNCLHTDNTKMIECLRKIKASNLISSVKNFNMIPFVPSFDGYFVIDDPYKLLKSGRIANKVPLIMGLTQNESGFLNPLDFLPSKWSDYPEGVILKCLQLSFKNDQDYLQKAARLATEKFIGSSRFVNPIHVLKKCFDILSDSLAITPVHETVNLLVKVGIFPYMYQYDYAGSILTKILKKVLGVIHGSDLLILFDVLPLQSAHNAVENRILSLWINFVTYGNPTPKSANSSFTWPKVKQNDIQVCHINEKFTLSKYKPEDDWRLHFWFKTIPDAIAEERKNRDY